MSLKKELSIAAISNWAGTICVFILAFVATPVIVHSFGNERYGIWSIAMSLTGYYGMLDMGIRTTIIKFFGQYIAQKEFRMANILVSTMFVTYGLIVPIILGAIILVVFKVESIFNIDPKLLPEIRTLLLIVGGNFCLNAFANTFRAVIVSLRKFVLRNSIEIVFSILRSIALISLLKLGNGLIVAAVAVLIVDQIMNLTFAFYAFRVCPDLRMSLKFINFKSMKGNFIFAFHNFVRHMSARILERSGVIIVGIIVDMKMVAFYSIADSLIRYLAKIPKGIMTIILPFSSKLSAENEDEKLRLMADILPKYTMSFFLLIILCFSLFGRQFVELWLGEGYDTAYQIVLILIWGKALTMSQGMLVNVLVGIGHSKFFGKIFFWEMIFNVALSVFLGKIYGVYGVVLGGLLTILVVNGILVPAYSLKKVKIGLGYYFLNVFVVPFIIVIFIYIINAYFLAIRSWGWLPVVLLEFVVLSYLFVWKELKIEKWKLKLNL